LLTSNELGISDSQVWDCSHDGDNLWGTAGRGWCPIWTCHRQVFGRFLFLLDESKFREFIRPLIELLEETEADFFVILCGWEDLREAVDCNITVEDTVQRIRRRLNIIVEESSKDIIFGGFQRQGGFLTEEYAQKVSMTMFSRSWQLQREHIHFFDVCCPSPSAPIERVYTWEGQYSDEYKAVILFALGRAVSLFLDNLWYPSSVAACTPGDIQFLRFASRLRGGERHIQTPVVPQAAIQPPSAA
jgi:hypothetical protein